MSENTSPLLLFGFHFSSRHLRLLGFLLCDFFSSSTQPRTIVIAVNAGLGGAHGHCVPITHVPFFRSPHGGVWSVRRQLTDASDRAVDSRGVLVRTNDRLQHFRRRTC